MVAACEACRRLKAKCSRSRVEEGSNTADDPCERCKQHNRTCTVSSSRPAGRRPGSLGRFNGVEKAIRKLQTELKKKKASPSFTDQDIHQILNFAQGRDRVLNLQPSCEDTLREPAETESLPKEISPKLRKSRGSVSSGIAITSIKRAISRTQVDHDPHYESDEPVSNPLGLVANAYEESQALGQQLCITRSSSASNTSAMRENIHKHLAHRLLNHPQNVSLGLKLPKNDLELGLNALLTREGQVCNNPGYFKLSKINQIRDTGPELDPVDLGLISMEEASSLFVIFFERLHPFNVILDPILHTPEFVRSQSALLFTWVLAIAAQFDHKSGQVARRLRFHGEHLSKHVYANGFKSVEIAQGYYISLLSATPANTMSEERSWLYTIYAFGVTAELALDLPLQNRSHVGSGGKATSSSQYQNEVETLPGDNISRSTVRRQRDRDETFTERLARNRERTWLRIVLWESAYSATRGRVSPFPNTELILSVESWHLHPLADPHDRYTCAFILLRQHLTRLHAELRRLTYTKHASQHWVLELIDSTLRPWCETWITNLQDPSTPLKCVSHVYLRHVYMHGRLWILSFALRGQIHEARDTRAIKEDCFEAAVECCESAVDDLRRIGEPLYCMLAPTWAMMSYAAVLALRLFPLLYGSQAGNGVELLGLLAQVAIQLERAGTTPSHRFGIAALLGQHLFMILQSRANAFKNEHENNAVQANSASDATCASENRDALETQPSDCCHPSHDPFLEVAFPSNEEDYWSDGFTAPLWDWFGQGCGGIV